MKAEKSVWLRKECCGCSVFFSFPSFLFSSPCAGTYTGEPLYVLDDCLELPYDVGSIVSGVD